MTVSTVAAGPGGPGDDPPDRPGGSNRPGGPGRPGRPGRPAQPDRPGETEPWTLWPASAPAKRHQWRLPLVLVALILLGGLVIALLVPAPRTNGYLDPAGTGVFGAHALTDILAERGHQVISTYSTSATLAAAGAGATIVITSPGLLTGPELTALSLSPADILLVAPDQRALTMLTAGITIASDSAPSRPVRPECDLAGAQLAGAADLGGITFDPASAPAGTTGCYPVGGKPALLRYSVAGKIVTILGRGAPLANGFLAEQGNAALALNLLTTSHRIVWLTPQAQVASGQGQAHSSGQQPRLIPVAALLVAAQLAIAALFAALWRARRLGPLIPEQLPVVVRASETVEGHARLYQSRRARDRAAAAMREAMLARVRPVLGLARNTENDAVARTLAARSRLSEHEVAMLVFGPPPAGDAGLVALVHDLDELEREVRSQ